MGLVNASGQPAEWPNLPAHWGVQTAPASNGTLLIDAAAEEVHLSGFVHWSDTTDLSKDIRKIHYAIHTASAPTGTWEVGLSDTALTAGPALRGDQYGAALDQSWTTATPPSTTGAQATGNLSADRTVAWGDRVTVVFRFSSYTSGNIALRSAGAANNAYDNLCQAVLVTAGPTYTAVAAIVNVVFEMADGTFGTLLGALPHSVLNAETFDVNATGTALGNGDERGGEFVAPWKMRVIGVRLPILIASGADCELNVYNNTTAVISARTIDANAVASNSGRPGSIMLPAPVDMNAGDTRIFAFKPTTSGDATMYSVDLGAAAHRAALFGTGINWVGRVDAGAWVRPTGYDARQFLMALLWQGFDHGIGSRASSHLGI